MSEVVGAPGPSSFLYSIVTKNVLLFLAILLVAIVPIAVRYERDSRDYEIQTLASKLEFFAERGATWIDTTVIERLRRPIDKQTDEYRRLLATLRRIEHEFDVDNAVVMRREADATYSYIAVGHDGFEIGEPVGIHALFPATYRATNDTWIAGEMMHSQLFGGKVAGTQYDQFLQINTPLKQNHQVVAILMLNKFANPVAAAVRGKTLRVVTLSVALVVAGLILFAFVSARMLRPLRQMTVAAGQVATGDLSVALPPKTRRDEVGLLSRAFHGMLEGLRQRDFIRDTFGRYVTREVVDTLLGSPEGLELGGEIRAVTILVADLRGFTALTSALPPNAVLDILNRYLARMVAIIQQHGGTIDEIQGDGMLAFFGAPLTGPDDPLRAVACAIEMQLGLEAFNAEQRHDDRPELAMGIGINTGEVVIGNIGSERRTKYGAVGTAINLTYRIESETTGGQILVSEATYGYVREAVQIRGTLTAGFKGVDGLVTLYDIAAVRGDPVLSLPEMAEEVLAPLQPPLSAACFPIEGKTLSATPIAARVIALGAGSAELRLDAPIEERSNVKLVISPASPTTSCEIYGKLVKIDRGNARLAFTSLSDDARARLEARRRAADPQPSAQDPSSRLRPPSPAQTPTAQ